MSKKSYSKRVWCDVLLLLSFLFLPWYVSLIFALMLTMVFARFWEGVILALFVDFVYVIPAGKIYGNLAIYSIVFLAIMFCAESLKKQMRFDI